MFSIFPNFSSTPPEPSVVQTPQKEYDPLPSTEPIKHLLNDDVIDVTELVKKNPPPPCYGREKEILWLADVVASTNKNAALLTGDPGVGKTLLIYHIAHLIMTGKAPYGLANRRILLMKSKGKVIFDQLNRKYRDHCLLVADEVHTLIQPPSMFSFFSESSDVLKPYIGCGGVPFLGLTDRPGEFMKDGAWKRRFQTKALEEMSIPSACQALIDSIPYLEKDFTKSIENTFPSSPAIRIEKTACEIAVKLSFIYLKSEYLPDKASKILEPACVHKLRQLMENDADVNEMKVTGADVIHYAMQQFKVTQKEIELKLERLEQDMRNTVIPPTAAVMRYSTNLNVLASQGKILPVYGRDKELDNIKAALCGVESNNVITVGPAGCGKTRLGEGLAYDIWKDNVPTALKGKQVLLLDLSKLLGDTKYRGDLEKNISEFLDSAREYEGSIILVIDEIHRLIGAGRTHGSNYDVANEFKEILARGKLPTLGMTTPSEYHILEVDPAFLRRFQTQAIEPFSPWETLEIMKKDKAHFEASYAEKNQRPFTIGDDAFEAAAFLATHYLRGEYLPATGYKIFHGACAAKAFRADQDGSPIVLKESDVIDYVNRIHTTPKDENSRKEVHKQLLRLKAELDPSNQLIPIQEPLIQFCDNWTNFARQGLFKKVSNRETDLNELYKILSCRTNNNALITGRPGSGKTTIVQGLAMEMVEGKVPSFLKGKIVLSLKLTELLQVSKTSSHPITTFIDSARKYAGQYVLLVDEFHMFFQIMIEGIPLIELFKPLLAEGKVRLIGATTHGSEILMNDSVSRRFQSLNLAELSIDQTVEVLSNSKKADEKFYSEQYNRSYIIDPQCFKTVVAKAKEKMAHQALPASAIKLMEEICADQGLNANDDQEKIEIRDQEVLAYCEKKFKKRLADRSWTYQITGLCASIASRIMGLFSRIKHCFNFLG